MIDIDLLRHNLELVALNMENRGYDKQIALKAYELDKEWKTKKEKLELLKSLRNKLNSEIAELKKAGKDASEQIAEMRAKGSEIPQLEKEVEMLDRQRKELLLLIPNMLHPSVPVAKDDSGNEVVRTWGNPSKTEKDTVPHYDMPGFDFKRGAKLGGHRFTVLSGWMAKLERALVNFMLDLHTSKGYKEFWLPLMVKSEIMQGTGQLPKFAEDLYYVRDDGLWLIPTAEVPLVGMHNSEIIEEPLPLFYMAYTPCFRREAGQYGKDIKGFIRQHQFDKVELVAIVEPEDSFKTLEKMVSDAEEVLKLLNIPYRVVKLCSSEVSFASAMTYDLELWIPSQGRYREVGSSSNCTDFQARRSDLRYRKAGFAAYPHTLNSSGLSVARTLVSLVENHYEDRGINVPRVLQPYAKTERVEMW
ncbi:MAG: serine--tRNA ligase [Candidatus Anstonellales archaeon]